MTWHCASIYNLDDSICLLTWITSCPHSWPFLAQALSRILWLTCIECHAARHIHHTLTQPPPTIITNRNSSIQTDALISFLRQNQNTQANKLKGQNVLAHVFRWFSPWCLVPLLWPGGKAGHCIRQHIGAWLRKSKNTKGVADGWILHRLTP